MNMPRIDKYLDLVHKNYLNQVKKKNDNKIKIEILRAKTSLYIQKKRMNNEQL